VAALAWAVEEVAALALRAFALTPPPLLTRDFSSSWPLRKAEIFAAMSFADEGALARAWPEPDPAPLVLLPALPCRRELAEEAVEEEEGTGVGSDPETESCFSLPADVTTGAGVGARTLLALETCSATTSTTAFSARESPL
jgi:hypothetical protein